MFDDWDIHCGLKTSGSRGLHIYVPLRPDYIHEQVRDTAHVIAKIWHQKIPKFTSLARMPDKRKNKVYLDYLPKVTDEDLDDMARKALHEKE